jgi:hypothetical protein
MICQFLIILVLAVLAYLFLINLVTHTKRLNRNVVFSTSNLRVIERKPKLADGCSAVYLDCGSNIGVQVRKLFEPELYPNAQVLGHFDRIFGPNRTITTGKVCAFGFEANPRHQRRLNSLQECYNSKGWRTQFFVPTAIANTNVGAVEFYEDDAKKENYWSSSIYEQANTVQHIKIPTLNLGQFIMDEIVGRTLPFGQDEPGPVYMKLDIEGAEYQALGSLLSSGAICHVTQASVEFHPQFLPSEEERKKTLMIREMIDRLPLLSEELGCEPMKVDLMDDESFRHDKTRDPENCSLHHD